MQRYENIEKSLHKELAKIDKKLENEADMSPQDLETVDCIYHALKSAEGYYTMAETSEMGYSGNYSGNYGGSGGSYARGRDSRGRYTSREMMSREGGYSGRYPMMPPMYSEYDGGRW